MAESVKTDVVFGSVVRHAITGAGAVLITKGIIDENTLGTASEVGAQIVGGVAVYALGQALSVIKGLNLLKYFGRFSFLGKPTIK